MSGLGVVLLLLIAGTVTVPPRDRRGDVESLLDRFHAAAARADETAYFDCFAKDGVFLGTDPSERWTVAEFRAYAHPHFATGKGWTYVPQERHVMLSEDERVAWFDETLSNAKYGTCRGTGVAVRSGSGWHVAHYSLTFLVPNDAAPAVVTAIKATAPAP